MRQWKCITLTGVLVLLLASASYGQDYKRIGGRLFLGYNKPVFGLNQSWYNQAAKWGGSLVYSMDAKLALEFEFHRIKYKNGKIEDRVFMWNVDNKEYSSPRAAANMRINSVLINTVFRLGDKKNLFTSQGVSPYVLLGAGFHEYKNNVSGLIYPGQTTEPLDLSSHLLPQQDRRAALGVNFGFGVEFFLSHFVALDFRVQHNFLAGNLRPYELWGVNEVWPIQMLDFEIAFKFYDVGKK
jgi:hypothetical protein